MHDTRPTVSSPVAAREGGWRGQHHRIRLRRIAARLPGYRSARLWDGAVAGDAGRQCRPRGSGVCFSQCFVVNDFVEHLGDRERGDQRHCFELDPGFASAVEELRMRRLIGARGSNLRLDLFQRQCRGYLCHRKCASVVFDNSPIPRVSANIHSVSYCSGPHRLV